MMGVENSPERAAQPLCRSFRANLSPITIPGVPEPASRALSPRALLRRAFGAGLFPTLTWRHFDDNHATQVHCGYRGRILFAYQRMNAKEELQLVEEIGTVESTDMKNGIMQTNNPFIKYGIRAGLAAGLEKGRMQGEAELVLRQLSRRLGKVQAADIKAIRKLDVSKIEDLGEALLQFSTYADLTSWLRKNKS
jgi:hypothetical protein